MKRYGLCIGIILSLIIWGCSGQEEPVKSKQQESSAQVKQEVKETVETKKKDVISEHEKLAKEMETKLAEYDKEVKELWKRTFEAAAEIKPQLNQEMEEVQKDLDAVKKKMAEWRSASGKAWDEMALGMETAMAELDKVYQKVRSKIK
jgi:hypothetical protein